MCSSDMVSDKVSDKVSDNAMINMALTILALIDIALTSALWHDLTVLALINVTDKYDSDMDSGSDWL